MRFSILIIGDEILSGRRQDRHLTHAIEALARRGRRLWGASVVGDDAARLTDALCAIRASDDVCFSFGGIGATPDDLTRQCVAAAYEVALERHPQAVTEIEAQYGADAYPVRVHMADLPQGARLIPNPVNRVPGFSLGRLHCLPGFPSMAWPMMDWVLEKEYAQLAPDLPSRASVVVHEVTESALVPWMNGFVQRHPSLKLFSLPHTRADGRREIELGVAGDADAARTALQEIKQMLDDAGHRYSEPE